jgi:hypothetical protein
MAEQVGASRGVCCSAEQVVTISAYCCLELLRQAARGLGKRFAILQPPFGLQQWSLADNAIRGDASELVAGSASVILRQIMRNTGSNKVRV